MVWRNVSAVTTPTPGTVISRRVVCVRLGHLTHAPIEFDLFVRHLLMHREQTVNDRAQLSLASKLAHTGTELCADGAREQ